MPGSWENEIKEWGTILADAFLYPFKGSAFFALVPGVLLGLTLSVDHSFLGFWWMFPAVGFCYSASYLVNIIRYTISGDETHPEWPSPFENVVEDLLLPGLAMIVALLIPIGLVMLANHFLIAPLTDSIWPETYERYIVGVFAHTFAKCFIIAYFALAMVAYAAHDSLWSVFPVTLGIDVWRGGFRSFLLLAVVIFTGVLAYEVAVIAWTDFIAVTAASCVGIYTSIFQARLLGLTHRCRA